MTKLDRLNSFLSERLTAALNEIIYTVSMTMKEYEEETARIREENHHLKQMLKVSGVTEANPDVLVISLPSGQQDCNSNPEQESKLQDSRNEAPQLKEESSSIKTEQPSYPTDAGAGAGADSDTKKRHTPATQPDCTVDPLRCFSPLNAPVLGREMLDDKFPAEIKVESADTDFDSDSTDDDTESTDSSDSSERCWSPQNWDVNIGSSDQNRIQQGTSRQPFIKRARSGASDSQNRPVEFRAAISFSDRITCNNTQHCTSKQCEKQRTIPKSSPVWKYFSLKEGDCSKAVCLICKAVISRGIKEYTTSALLRHLRGKHGKC
ncbi:hypothetical protein NFI96_020308 [Prochilodus magdalenae]|nr:hypothetical protein NFI96_020308 [Prochilodus magdalenae]